MVHRSQEDQLEEVKKEDVVSLGVGDSFSVFDSYFWFTICDRNTSKVVEVCSHSIFSGIQF
jgi:hypothetical protein